MKKINILYLNFFSAYFDILYKNRGRGCVFTTKQSISLCIFYKIKKNQKKIQLLQLKLTLIKLKKVFLFKLKI